MSTSPTLSPRQPAAPLTPGEDKRWASLAHFGGVAIVLFLLVSFVSGPAAQVFFALLTIVPALLIRVAFGRRGPRTLVESKEALNFQLTLVVVLIVWVVLSGLIIWAVVGNFLFGLDFGAYSVLYVALGVPSFGLALICVLFSVIGGFTVLRGLSYSYPVAVRLFR